MSSKKAIAYVCVLIFASLCVILRPCSGEESPLYKFVMKDINGEEVGLSEYKGKVLLIVNVASECGYTDEHYKELVQLQDDFPLDDFNILAFPCNQFGHQEPNDDKSISKFVHENYNVNFRMFSKIDVGGEHAHPLYVYLYKATSDYPKWNFGKYLVDRKGRVVKFFPQTVTPSECAPYIELLIENKSIDSYHTDL